MNQIPDHAAERVLNTIEEVVNLADEELEDAEKWMKALVGEFPEASIVRSYYAWVLSREGKHREAIEHGRAGVKLSPEDRKVLAGMAKAVFEVHKVLDTAAQASALQAARQTAAFLSQTRVLRQYSAGAPQRYQVPR